MFSNEVLQHAISKKGTRINCNLSLYGALDKGSYRLWSMKFKYIIMVLVCLLAIGPEHCMAQQLPRSQPNDTENESGGQTMTKAKKTKGKFKANWALPYPNPYRAAIYSLVLPSAGQIYNKRYWKAPIVWAGFGGLVYAVNYNKEQRNCFASAYGAAISGDQHKFSGRIDAPDALRTIRNNFDKNLQLSYLGFFALYALTTLDAYVDAHLKNFDISDELSWIIRPVPIHGEVTQLPISLGIKWQL